MALCKEITVDIRMGPNLRLMLDILNLAVDAIDLSQVEKSLRDRLMARATTLEARVEAAMVAIEPTPPTQFNHNPYPGATFNIESNKIDLTPAPAMSTVIVGNECMWQEMPIAATVKSTITLGDKVVFNDDGLLVPLCDQFKDRPAHTVIGVNVPSSPVEAAKMAAVLEEPAKPARKGKWEFLGAP